MEGTFIVSDFKPFIKERIEQLGINESFIIPYTSIESESDWHDWTTRLFKDRQVNNLIIPISISIDNSINTDGLKIALHIRLNYELTKEQRLIPIILLSDFSIDVILRKNNFDIDNNPQNLLFTKGIYLSTFDIEEIKNTIKKAEPCPIVEYHSQVLNKLKIIKKTSIGGHDIGNAWGCFKLAQVTGLRDQIFKLDSISEHLKKLYAKYLICYNDAYKEETRIDLAPLRCSRKKILFIDDKADEGWSVLMKSIFRSAGDDFVSVDSSKYKNKETKLFHDFGGFYSEAQSHIGKEWDLIIIDLRLYPEKEDIDNDMIAPTEFTGYKLIDEFLMDNAGYQIIVSTASNKIWNINAALYRGATSYYVKESPEFNYSINETKKQFDNFKNDVKKSYERCYLRDIYRDIQNLKLNLDGLAYPTDFINEIKNQLDLAFNMLSNAKSKEQFAYAYVSLYLIIETVNKQFVAQGQDTDKKWFVIDAGNLNAWYLDKAKKTYYPFTIDKDNNKITEVTGNKPPEWQKFAGIYFQKWGKTDFSFILTIRDNISKRNGFIHNNRSFLDEQDVSNKYIHHDIYQPNGFLNLFNCIKEIINWL